jgi:translocation and assembly module TamB
MTGGVTLGNGGVSGDLGLHGGGLDGTVHLAPQDGGQMVKALILARNAKFGGDKPIAIGNAKLDVDGLFGQGNSTLNANLAAQGLPWARSSWAAWRPAPRWSTDRAASPPRSPGGVARSSRCRAPPPIEPDKIIAYVAGNYAGRTVDMPRRHGDGARGRAAGSWSPRKSPSGAAS